MTGLYIHIPFCRNKCFYCSFIVAIHQDHHADDYIGALAEEAKNFQKTTIDSVYFGGGTPSHLGEKQFSFLAQSLFKNFQIADDAEITVELNPEDVAADRLRCYRDCGVNRLSLGAQTFQDRYLKVLGRCHNAKQISGAYDQMRANGFNNISLDLMYGLPEQSLEEIDMDLAMLDSLQSDHVSLYSLTVEPGSRFFVQGAALPRQDDMAKQYLHVRDRLVSRGFEHYEVSNFAVAEKRSSHNMNYWQGGNYIGLGVGAHSHRDGRRWWNVGRIREYIKRVSGNMSAEDGHEDLDPEQRLAEALVFGLRMTNGVDLKDIQERYQRKLSHKQQEEIARLVEGGFLIMENHWLRPEEKGLLVLDEISARLL